MANIIIQTNIWKVSLSPHHHRSDLYPLLCLRLISNISSRSSDFTTWRHHKTTSTHGQWSWWCVLLDLSLFRCYTSPTSSSSSSGHLQLLISGTGTDWPAERLPLHGARLVVMTFNICPRDTLLLLLLLHRQNCFLIKSHGTSSTPTAACLATTPPLPPLFHGAIIDRTPSIDKRWTGRQEKKKQKKQGWHSLHSQSTTSSPAGGGHSMAGRGFAGDILLSCI